MTTPSEAHEATTAAEQAQKDTEAAFVKQNAEAEKARTDAERVRQQADADPSTSNLAALAEANQKAAEETRKAAVAAKARNDALTAANDARIAEVQAIVAATNEKMIDTKGNPNGIQLKTDLNLDQFTPANYARLILNNFSVRVTGVERKVVLGASGSFILGAKNEVVLACKNNLIVGFETKTVTGANRNNFLGLKMDTIGGAKIDKTYGPKREFHAGPKAYLGPADTTVQPEKQTRAGVRKAAWEAAKELFKKDENVAGRRHLRASKVLADIEALEAKIATLKEKADSEEQRIKNLTLKTATLKIKCSGNLAYEAKGTTTIDGGGAKVVLDGAAELSKGGSVKCDSAGVSVNGKVLIN